MKKSIILFFMVLALLMTSTVPALALGNEFTFSVPWFKGILNNSLVNFSYYSGDVSDTQSNVPLSSIVGGNIKNRVLSLDNSIVDNSSNYTFFDYGEEYITDPIPTEGYKRLIFECPFPVTVKPNQVLKLQAVFIIKWQPRSVIVDSNRYSNVRCTARLHPQEGSIISLNSSPSLFYSNASVGTVSYSSGVYNFNPEFTGNAFLTDISWVNTTGSDVVVDYLGFTYISPSNLLIVPGYSFGFLAENVEDSVVLPSYVEENLIDIKNEILNQGEDFKKLLFELDELQLQIDDLISAQGASSSTTNNYYETITIPSDSQKDRIAILQEAVNSAKEELEELKKITESVKVPTSAEVLSGTTPDDIQLTIDDALTNSDVNNVLSILFNNSIVVTMLLSTISIGAVGYIFFGKKG